MLEESTPPPSRFCPSGQLTDLLIEICLKLCTQHIPFQNIWKLTGNNRIMWKHPQPAYKKICRSTTPWVLMGRGFLSLKTCGWSFRYCNCLNFRKFCSLGDPLNYMSIEMRYFMKAFIKRIVDLEIAYHFNWFFLIHINW